MQARILGGALILGYHRVADVDTDVYDVCVSTRYFDEHMVALNKFARPISLSALVQHLKDDSLPPKSVAVTFDDGYADNLHQAKPILEKYQVPATVFVCTGFLGKEFWWDELERLVMSSRADLSTLHLQVGEKLFVSNQPRVSPEADTVESRRQFRHALYDFILALNVEGQHNAMTMIRSWSGTSSDKATTSRAMSDKELLQLADGGLIELGSHTRHHPMLPQLSFEEQKAEIVSGKDDLDEILGRTTEGFSYPNGKATPSAKQIVQAAGFTYACTSLHDVVRNGNDEYELTRFWQKDVDGESFMRGLSVWMKMQRDHAQ
jgi:peptidoglycan/xylan/chitin deacetylase (PgdA/CDA1 family)